MKTYIKVALLAFVISVIVQVATSYVMRSKYYHHGYNDAINRVVKVMEERQTEQEQAKSVESFVDHSRIPD
ncbi:MAG: hypothetical protein EOO88_31565 [Pedobacter sp.]|nr:MAG: hypothetical protein EOO88_31565 [Pedobacter sp.]